MCLISYICKLYSFCRIIILKLFTTQNVIIIEGIPNINSKVDIEVAPHAILKIGRGFHARKYSLLAVRPNAELIIGRNVFINRNVIITALKKIVIGDGVTIGPNVCIYDHDHDICNRGGYLLDNVTIGKNTWIGSNVSILKGVIIGENAVIASGCVVTKDVPDNTILIQKRINNLKPIIH